MYIYAPGNNIYFVSEWSLDVVRGGNGLGRAGLWKA